MSKFANKRILVTGATGLIGSHIVRRLLMIDGIEVLALGRSIEKIKSTFEDVEYSEKLVAVQHDISQPLPTDIGKLDYILNSATLQFNIFYKYLGNKKLPRILSCQNFHLT